MPYSIPAPAPAPLPIHSQGRPGHRRSFSEIAYSSTNTNMAASTSSNPPRQTSGAFAPLGSLPRRKPASFHLEADDDDDSSPEDEAGSNGPSRPQPTPHPAQTQRRISPNSSSSQINLRPTPPGRPINLPSEDEDDELARGLPPLKLKIPSSTPGLNIPFSPSPTATTTIQPNTLPFPRTISPPRSRTASMDTISVGSSGVQFQVKSATPTGTRSGNTTPTGTESPRPAFPRTASTPVLLSNASSTGGPIILSNGKPLKSSLKSSSSSPNIPFPSQSLVPSRIYAEIAKKQAEERERLANSAGNSPVQESGTYPPDFASEFGGNRHARAASAPALPSLTLTSEHGTPLDTCPPTPSAPKAVHFPSSDDGALATVKFFKRSARPASLSVPGASGGEETETETDGEGYNSGPGSGYNGYNANTSWGQWGGGYTNPWDRYTAQNSKSNSSSSGSGSSNAQRGPTSLNVPRLASPLGPQAGKLPQRQPTQRKKVEEKKLVYEVDRANSSDVPRRDLGLFDNVFLEDVQLDAPSTSTSGQDDGSQSKITSLKGSLLVRNLAYEKHVSVRFTLDGWHTTSEVKAEYKESLDKLPAWIVGVLRGDRTMSKDDGSKPSSVHVAPSNPQWDRFTFSIDLSDYARSRSLANRTLWMVVRFGVPGTVRVPLGVPLLSRDFTPIHAHSSSGSSSSAPQLDVMSPSSPDLLSTLISGIAGSPNPSPTSQAAYAKGREIVEEVLKRVRCCVGVGVGNEWWDNNGGGNFRVGFKEREVVDVKEEEVPVEAPAEAVDGAEAKPADNEATQAKEGGAPHGTTTRTRRANAVSCPPMFSGNAPPPPPMSILDKSLSHSSLSPPQISASTSLDSASSSSSAPPTPSASSLLPSSITTTAAASLSAASPSYSLGGPSSQSGTPKPWPQRTPAANKAMAETTLERLKRLNLRNYAAPSVSSTGRVTAAPVPPPAIITTPATATTVRSPPAAQTATSTAAEVKVKDFGASNANGKADGPTAPNSKDDGLSAEGPPSRTSSVSSTSSWTSSNSTDSRSGSGSGSGSETTPMTSPLCTPTSMRSSVWDGATPTKDESAVAAAVEESKEVVDEKEGVELEPSLGRATPRPIVAKPNTNDSGATTLKKGDGIDVSPNAMLTSPLLGAFMAGPPSASGEGYDPLDAGLMGTSPPFSMFGAGAVRPAGSTRSVVFGWGEPASKDSDSSSSVSSSGEDTAKTPTPATIPLITTKPSNLILDSIREKNVSSPMRSPGGSGRNSPVTGAAIPNVSSSSNLSAHFNPTKDSKESRAPTRPTLVATTSNYTNLKEAKTGSGSDSGSPSTSKSGSGSSSGSKNGSHPRRHHHHRGGSSSTSKSGLLSPLPLTMSSSPLQSPTSISPSNSFSGLQQQQSGNVNPGSRSNSLDDIRDPDSIYQAFVRQWCFASGPAPQQAGGFGTMNSSSKEAGERKKHAM